MLLLVAPALYAASIYMVLGRLVRRLRAERFSIVRPTWMTGIFVTGDVFSFLVQGSGGGLLASRDRQTAKTGNDLIIAGLCIQIVLFGFFAISSAIFHLRVHRAAPGAIVQDTKRPWQSTMHMLYLASALILVRSVFRLIEYIQGNDGYLLSVEWPLYVFDAVLMWWASVAFLYWYPEDIKPHKATTAAVGRDEEADLPLQTASSIEK